jgi:hypothetical protein
MFLYQPGSQGPLHIVKNSADKDKGAKKEAAKKLRKYRKVKLLTTSTSFPAPSFLILGNESSII